MIIQALTDFVAANTKKNPKTGLPAGIGVEARNIDTQFGDLRGLLSPAIAHSAPGFTTQRVSLYRFGRDAPSDTQYWILRVVDADYVRSLIAEDTTEKTYVTDGGVNKPRYFDTTTLGAGPTYPASYVDLGVPFPDTAMTAAIQVVGVATTTEERVYGDTFLRANGDESTINPNLTSITCKTDATIRLSAFDAMPAGAHGITKRRIYCSTDGGPFQRCAEITVGTATFDDNGTVRGLVCSTGGDENVPAWLPPPDNLAGLIGLWNGMIAGFVGKSLRVCEIDHPHAWPIEYEETIVDTIVGTATFGNTWVICTSGQVYVATGSTPLSIRSQQTYFKQACVSKRSVVGVGHGVCFASNDGLCYYGSKGAAVLTESFMDAADWQALNPSSIIGVCWRGWYLGAYYNGTDRKMFMINTDNPQGINFIDRQAFGFFYDTVSESVYLLLAFDSDNNLQPIRKWYANPAQLAATFKGAKVRHPYATNPSVAMVVATTYPVTYKLWADDVLVLTEVVTSEQPFTVPGGDARYFQQQIEGMGPIEAVVLAEDVMDLP